MNLRVYTSGVLGGPRSRLRHLMAKLTGRPIVHFLHVGKTGGTSIKHVLRNQLTAGDYTILLHGHSVSLRDIPRGEKVVFFLREPTSRFVSSFYSRQREGKPRLYIPWRPEEAVAFSRFKTANELAGALSSPTPELKEQAVHAMKNIYHVRDTFWRWFIDEDYLKSRADDVLFVGFQERMDEDFKRLKETLGLKNAPDLPTDEVAAHRNPSSTDKRLDDQAKANLAQWYAGDAAFYQRYHDARTK